ncbi:hypothetical protein FA13DRAFT_1802804 [Coprinellus micaceus]|uniref:Alpha-type protein kinase domain-containing protein n=1 Tax=Coprinellus micaceus TaxID=71717 RepID=A0A4Y7SB62_COPMI|nr:hypothetical protein FA13DRAFT_1802804 [Coprinellus micaceus]
MRIVSSVNPRDRHTVGRMFMVRFQMNDPAHAYDLRFADAFLMQEIGDEPSGPSGMPKKAEVTFSDDEVPPGFMWLIEERHISKTISHISGTLAHPTSHVDLVALTVYAFMHYGFGRSNRLLVFADLQGTPGSFKLNGKRVNGTVLFDPMTHTTKGDSGVGDFGTDGIAAFIQQHRCREICKRLGLDKDVPLRENSALNTLGEYESEDEGGPSAGDAIFPGEEDEE